MAPRHVTTDGVTATSAAGLRGTARAASLWLAAIVCCIVFTPAAARASGDLFLNVPCDAEGFGEGMWLKAEITVWTGNELYYTESFG